MKGSLLRVLCATLLLFIGMGIMAGVILAMPEEETLTAWTKVTFQTMGKQTLSLYNKEGTLIDTMETDGEGKCTTDLLEEGTYYGVCREGLVEFSLNAYGIEKASGGAVATDKNELLFSSDIQPGELRIYGKARQAQYIYELSSRDYSYSHTLNCEVGRTIECVIENLPYGDYTLTENGRVLCRVEITEGKPMVEISLP